MSLKTKIATTALALGATFAYAQDKSQGSAEMENPVNILFAKEVKINDAGARASYCFGLAAVLGTETTGVKDNIDPITSRVMAKSMLAAANAYGDSQIATLKSAAYVRTLMQNFALLKRVNTPAYFEHLASTRKSVLSCDANLK